MDTKQGINWVDHFPGRKPPRRVARMITADGQEVEILFPMRMSLEDARAFERMTRRIIKEIRINSLKQT